MFYYSEQLYLAEHAHAHRLLIFTDHIHRALILLRNKQSLVGGVHDEG